jgi:large subunit ribosomal protein L18
VVELKELMNDQDYLFIVLMKIFMHKSLMIPSAKTLISCSTLDRSIQLAMSNGRTCDAAKLMGEKLAEFSLKKNITKIVFDRGPYLYHGRIKALADGARAGGLQF